MAPEDGDEVGDPFVPEWVLVLVVPMGSLVFAVFRAMNVKPGMSSTLEAQRQSRVRNRVNRISGGQRFDNMILTI